MVCITCFEAKDLQNNAQFIKLSIIQINIFSWLSR